MKTLNKNCINNQYGLHARTLYIKTHNVATKTSFTLTCEMYILETTEAVPSTPGVMPGGEYIIFILLKEFTLKSIANGFRSAIVNALRFAFSVYLIWDCRMFSQYHIDET